MRRRKKITLALVGLLLVTQTPFMYRRYRLGRLAAAIRELNSTRAPAPTDDAFDEYAGVFHVHSSLGGHSTGTFGEIVSAAKSERLSFVVMTEHPASYVDTAAATLNGTHEGVLFVGGSELAASDGGRLFVAPGLGEAVPGSVAFRDLVARGAAREGGLSVVGYPEQVREWPAGGYDGVEVYNLYTNSKRINYALLFFDSLWSYWGHADLLFATFYERPGAVLKRWDESNAGGAHRASALAGNDAHANVGISFQEQTGERIFHIRLDPYERSFRVVRNHVLLERGRPLSAEALLEALKRGRGFIAFDIFGDATGFRFEAEGGAGRRTMGEEIALEAGGPVKLSARSPVKCRTVFFRDGEIVSEVKDSASAEMTVERAGVYRVELYLDQLGGFLEGKPWVISNPIYVR